MNEWMNELALLNILHLHELSQSVNFFSSSFFPIHHWLKLDDLFPFSFNWMSVFQAQLWPQNYGYSHQALFMNPKIVNNSTSPYPKTLREGFLNQMASLPIPIITSTQQFLRSLPNHKTVGLYRGTDLIQRTSELKGSRENILTTLFSFQRQLLRLPRIKGLYWLTELFNAKTTKFKTPDLSVQWSSQFIIQGGGCRTRMPRKPQPCLHLGIFLDGRVNFKRSEHCVFLPRLPILKTSLFCC